jgi:hypothetical protein
VSKEHCSILKAKWLNDSYVGGVEKVSAEIDPKMMNINQELRSIAFLKPEYQE